MNSSPCIQPYVHCIFCDKLGTMRVTTCANPTKCEAVAMLDCTACGARIEYPVQLYREPVVHPAVHLVRSMLSHQNKSRDLQIAFQELRSIINDPKLIPPRPMPLRDPFTRKKRRKCQLTTKHGFPKT